MMFLVIMIASFCHHLEAASGAVSLTIRIEPGVRELLAGKTSSTTLTELEAFENALGSCREGLSRHFRESEVKRIMRSIIGDSIVVSKNEAWLSRGSRGGFVVRAVDGTVYAL